MVSNPSLRVACPDCGSSLVVDAATGVVLSHEPLKEAGAKADMDAALRALKTDKTRRDDLFRQSLSAEASKTDVLNKKFNEAVRRARENPGVVPPPREVDL